MLQVFLSNVLCHELVSVCWEEIDLVCMKLASCPLHFLTGGVKCFHKNAVNKSVFDTSVLNGSAVCACMCVLSTWHGHVTF